MKTNGNDAAFAIKDDNFLQEGLTKREYFAAKAMQALITNEQNFDYVHNGNEAGVAKDAVLIADALIEALNKEKK